MAPFDRDALDGDIGWRLVSDTFVTLFSNKAILAETTGWLRDHHYRLTELQCATWDTEADLHRDVAAAFSFPDYYGCNLDALNDCLSDVVDYAYGSSEDTAGTVMVLHRFDHFAARCGSMAQAVLDIWAGQARTAALLGHRMICLVQSDDQQIDFAPVGAQPVMWNQFHCGRNR